MIDQLGIGPLDISEIIGREINCYLGIPGYACCSLAVFVSLQSPAYEGKCNGIINSVVFITDNWDPEAYEKWRSNLEQIRSSAYLEIYLIVGNKVTEVQF